MAVAAADAERSARGAARAGRGSGCAPIRTGSTCPPPSSTACCSCFPTFASLFFSLTRWTLFEATFIGLDNFAQFFREPFLVQGLDQHADLWRASPPA